MSKDPMVIVGSKIESALDNLSCSMLKIADGMVGKSQGAAITTDNAPVIAMLQQHHSILERVVQATESTAKHANATAVFQQALLEHFKSSNK